MAGSSWVLGLLAAIGSWNVDLLTPAGGLDPSWQAALYMAAHRGMHFGTQIVFTYGPLGFLRLPGLWYQGLGILSFLYWGGLYVLLCVSLVWALRQSLNGVVAFLLTLLVLAAAPGIETPIALAAVWCLAVLYREVPAAAWRVVAFGGGVLGATETLALPRSGLVIVVMCAATLLAHPRRWRGLGIFAGCLALTLVVSWFATGQAVSNVGDFARNAEQVVSGYSEAMGDSSTQSLYTPAAVLIGAALVVGAGLGAQSRARRIFAAIAIAAAAFTLYKEAIVRQDTGHSQILFATAAAIALGLAVTTHRWLSAGAVLAAVVLALATPRSASQPLSLNPLTHARQASDQVQTLASPGRTRFVGAIGMALHYGLTPATLGILRGHTVDVDPWEAALAWVYGLNWDPLPVIQDYSAYTATLDQLDAEALASSQGPERILRENVPLVDPGTPAGTIDGRAPAWDPPAKSLAMLCHYVPLQTTPRWQVLGRGPDRCGSPQLIASATAREGQTVSLPHAGPGELVYAKLGGAGVSGLERLRTLLFRARFRYATVNRSTTYRLVPGTAGDGLLIDAGAGADFPAPFSLSPAARTIAVFGAGTITLRVYRMSVA